MKKNLLSKFLLILVVFALTSVPAKAVVDTLWTINGTIDHLQSGIAGGFWDDSVKIGTPITITTSFNSHTIPDYFSDWGGGSYKLYDFKEGSSVIQFGNYSFKNNDFSTYGGVGTANQYNNNQYDIYKSVSGIQLSAAPSPYTSFYGLKNIEWGSVMLSDLGSASKFSLPPEELPLSAFDVQKNISFRSDADLNNMNDSYVFFTGNITGYAFTPIVDSSVPNVPDVTPPVISGGSGSGGGASGVAASAPGAPAPPLTACLAFAGVLILQALRNRRSTV